MSNNRERFERIYSHYYPHEVAKANGGAEIPVKAFCHDDHNDSMSINLENGTYYCFKCGEGDDEIGFIRNWARAIDNKEISFSKAKAKATALSKGIERDDSDRYERFEQTKELAESREPIDPNKVEIWHGLLMKNQKQLEYLYTKRGLTEETVRQFKLGFDQVDRIFIPVPNLANEYVNIRKYNKDAKGKDKMISYGKGYGGAQLFPVQNLQYDEILLNEGEWDCILANQMGYHAVTLTGGANTSIDEFAPLFKDKVVNICYDVDKAGVQGAKAAANALYGIAKQIKIIRLPITDIPNGDYSDFVVSLGHRKSDIDAIISHTNPFTSADEIHELDDHENMVTLDKSTNAKYDGKRICMNVIVAGKDTTPYKVPKEVEIRCEAGEKRCERCPMLSYGGVRPVSIRNTDRDVLKLLDCDDSKQKRAIKELVGILPTCSQFEVNITEKWNVEQLTLMPELDASDEDSRHILMTTYVIGSNIDTNTSYTMHGVALADPRNQQATHLINKFEPTQDTISSFSMSREVYDRLKIFQAEDIESKLGEIYGDYERNVTRIYGRRDLHLAADLVFHSALSFKFEGREERRGWVEGLIIGDTRTGKSETILRLQQHYRLGEFLTAENSSFAGLVGGMQKNGRDGWIITWGKIPLNDRRMVVIDEMSGLSERDIEIMSGIRSSGVAEITKIQTEKTHARTRLLWISNDREGKGLNKYDYGVDAVVKLVGKNEDIARFEFVITAASDEVPKSIINTKESDRLNVPHVYTSDLSRELILWAWSRKTDDVVFTPDAVDAIFKYSSQMGDIYTSKVPLVESANQRIKIARLSVALASRVFSTDESGEKVIVESKHVKYVYDYLNTIYSKKSLGYRELSMLEKEQERRAGQNKTKVEAILNKTADLAEVLMSTHIISSKDLEDMMDLDRVSVRKYIKELMKYGMIVKDSGGWVKTPEFIGILRKWLFNNPQKDEEEFDDAD